MKPSWAEVSRIEEVRTSARGWKSAGAIDAPTLAAIDAAYPDQRVRLHGFWRVLVFILTSVIVTTLFAFVQTDSTLLALSVVFGLLLAGATEGLRGSRYSGTGADGATSFWAVVFLLVAAADVLFRHRTLPEETAITAMIAAAAVVAGLAAWRWGFWFYAACGTAALYGLLGRLPLARLLWIVISIAAMRLLRRALDAPRLAPALRRCAAAAFAVPAAALYAAVNLFSADRRLIEMLQGRPDYGGTDGDPTGATRLLAIFGTAVVPVIYLAWGVRSRRRLLIGLGLLTAALSLVTLRYYVHIARLWEVLAVCGAVLIGVAIVIQRALRARPASEWRGLTAEPLYERERAGISPLAAIVAHSIGGAAQPAPEPKPGLTTGGGQYGGGGASGSY